MVQRPGWKWEEPSGGCCDDEGAGCRDGKKQMCFVDGGNRTCYSVMCGG